MLKKLLIITGILCFFTGCSGKIITLGVLKDSNQDLIKEIARAVERETGHTIIIDNEISNITNGETDLLNREVDIVMTFNSEDLELSNNNIRNLNSQGSYGKNDRLELVNLGPVFINNSVLFSKHKNSSDIPDNALVVININSKYARDALRIMEQEGLVTLDHKYLDKYYPSAIDMFQNAERIITENSKNIKFAIYEPLKKRITKIYSDGKIGNYEKTQKVKEIFNEGGIFLFSDFDYTEIDKIDNRSLLSLFTKFNKLLFIQEKGHTLKLKDPTKENAIVLATRSDLKDSQKILDFTQALKSPNVKAVLEKYSNSISSGF